MQKKCSKMRYSGIGGQAVMEGVMMRNKDSYAVAVRTESGEIKVMRDKFDGVLHGSVFTKIPFIRGIFAFADSLVLGMKTLNYSSDIYMQTGSEDKSGKDAAEDRTDSGKKDNKAAAAAQTGIIMVIAVIIAIGLFMLLPYYVSMLFRDFIKNGFVLSLIEGVIRLLVFILYILAISAMQDIKRVFMYHGAEHKCINCIENGKELNVENVRASSKQHRRCGTSFLLYVMVISIIFFAFIQTPDRILRVVLRIVLIPVIAGVAYELIRLAGRSSNPLVRALSAPGLWMQVLTTKEPDDSMIEVGIRSVEEIFDWRQYLKDNFGNDTAENG